MARGKWHDFAMATSRKHKRLSDAYRFDGFRPLDEVQGVFGDRVARVVTLVRRSKKRAASAGRFTLAGTTAHDVMCATCPAVACGCTWTSRFAGFDVGATAA